MKKVDYFGIGSTILLIASAIVFRDVVKGWEVMPWVSLISTVAWLATMWFVLHNANTGDSEK